MFQWSSVIMVSNILTYHYFFIQFYSNNILGEVDDDINFSYEENTEVDYSCAASLNNDMWVFGGTYKTHQVSFEWPDTSSYIDNG